MIQGPMERHLEQTYSDLYLPQATNTTDLDSYASQTPKRIPSQKPSNNELIRKSMTMYGTGFGTKGDKRGASESSSAISSNRKEAGKIIDNKKIESMSRVQQKPK